MVVKIKKWKVQKSVIKRKYKFEDYKTCLEATRLENEISNIEKKNDVDSCKEFIKTKN